jgi:hypothetical protein
MKTVMSGVALAAILALAMPAWADAPGKSYRSDARGKGVSMSHSKHAHATRGSHARGMSHRTMNRSATARMGGGASPTDNVANDLNRAEAQRLMTGGSTPPMGGPNMGPMGNPNMGPMGGPNPNMGPMGGPNPNMGPMGGPNQPRPIPGQ